MMRLSPFPLIGRTASTYLKFAVRGVKTTWIMDPADVTKALAAGEWNSWVLQVNVSGAGRKNTHAVTWFQQPPQALFEMDIDVDQNFGAYITSKTKYEDGQVIDPDSPTWAKESHLNTFSRFDVSVGSCYNWTGSALEKDPLHECAKGSIKIVNTAKDIMTTGLTKLPPKDSKKRPICADKLFPAPPVQPDQNAVVYTPTALLYTTTGKKYVASSLVKDLTKQTTVWSMLDLSLGTTFNYKAGQWVQSK